MTLHPALARLARGATRLYWDLPKRLILGARAYRFEGEQAAHAEQLRETEISLALMQSASDDPDHVRMASEIEHGAENRLSVLLGKARLTMEEKGERDAIQRAISARRQSFAAPAAAQPRRFLPALPAVAGLALRPWMLWTGALAAVALWGGYNDVRAGRAENQRDEARAALDAAERHLSEARTVAAELAEQVAEADTQTRQTAATIEAERARRLRAEAEARRIRNEQRRAIEHVPDIDYGFGGVRDDGAVPPSSGGSDPASDRPG